MASLPRQIMRYVHWLVRSHENEFERNYLVLTRPTEPFSVVYEQLWGEWQFSQTSGNDLRRTTRRDQLEDWNVPDN
ncbi:hypothetical protein HK104_000687 [Borealophlyctis nickersoniae]|nr:hypothetical protein HK104_000687 [Borealophlyctis nickersoniae]